MSLPEAPDTDTNTPATEDAVSTSETPSAATDTTAAGAAETSAHADSTAAAASSTTSTDSSETPDTGDAADTSDTPTSDATANDATAHEEPTASEEPPADGPSGDGPSGDGPPADEPPAATPEPAPVAAADVGARLVELATEAEALAKADNAHQAVQRWHAIQSERDQLVARDDVEAAGDDLLARFTAAGEVLDALHQRAEKQARDKLSALAGQLEEMVATEELVLRKAERKLRDAQDFLKDPPDAVLPRKEWQDLKRRLETAREALMPKVRELEQLEEWKRWANVPVQEQLCEKIEALLERSDFPKMARELREAQAEWKKVAAAPREKSEILWRRFKTAGDQVRDRCKVYFSEQDKVRQENLKQKIQLCEQAEALQESDDWGPTANELKRLQAEWKAIGPVPRKQSDSIWKRFRKACDSFFERRKEHLGDLHKDREENLTAKVALCEKAEALQNSTDWAKGTETFKQMQIQWKTIGPVPRKHSETLWKRFRGACDRFFDRRSRKDEIHLDDNLVVREEVVSELEALLPEARAAEAKKAAAKARKEAAKKAAGEAAAAKKAAAEEAAKKAAETPTDGSAEEKPAEEKPAEEPADAASAEVVSAEAVPTEEEPDEDKPTEDKPTEDKPTEDKPVAEDKPAEEAATEDKPSADKPVEEPAPLGPPEELADVVRKAQQVWDSAGQMPSGKATAVVEERYRKVRTALMDAYPDGLEGTDLDPQAIEARREKIVERLETLVEKRRQAQEAAAEKEPSLADLAAQIKAAMASNTIRRGGAGDSAARSADEREAQRIEVSWRQIPGKASKEIVERYKQAKAAFEETLTS